MIPLMMVISRDEPKNEDSGYPGLDNYYYKATLNLPASESGDGSLEPKYVEEESTQWGSSDCGVANDTVAIELAYYSYTFQTNMYYQEKYGEKEGNFENYVEYMLDSSLQDAFTTGIEKTAVGDYEALKYINDYVFAADTTIYAQWTSTGGSYTPPSKPSVSVDGGGGKVTSDRNGTVTITPDEGYQIEKITVNGKEVEIPADGKLTGLKPSDKVVVTFTKTPTVTVEQFTDIAPGAWYYDAVKYAVDHSLFYGTSDTTFSPNSTMTRGMLATVLYRMESEPESDPADFLDVGSGKYYSEAVAWAAANGIVEGYGNGNFGPEDAITREQLAAILYRYSGSPASDGTLTGFADSDAANGYALDALRWAVEQGIIKGKGNGILDPGGRATRAEVAAMLQRFCKKAGR